MIPSLRPRSDFPIFSQLHPSGKALVYLDSAATSQKPKSVLDSIIEYYTTSNANVHRGVHFLGDKSTTAWLAARVRVATFFGCEAKQLIAVRNTTEALNLVAYSLEKKLEQGDVILSTQMEHHSNLVPWQQLALRTGASLELIPVTSTGILDLQWMQSRVQQIGPRMKVLALSHVSNTLGTINPIPEVLDICRKSLSGSYHLLTTVIDGAQAAPHIRVDFQKLGVDFYAVSAHKMLGPMGIGGLFVGTERMNDLQPWLFGGGMIGDVTTQYSTWADEPQDRFTAGTPDVAGMVGWAAACRYLQEIDMRRVQEHDGALVRYALEKLADIPGLCIVGPQDAVLRCGSVAFLYNKVHAHDIAQILDSEGVAVRSGHHCTMPLHTAMGWAATTRLSFSVYNSSDDVDVLCEALQQVDRIILH